MLIVFDLDGTLLKDDKTISDYSLRILNELKEKGHILVACTGRALSAFPNILKDICDYAILCTGSLIYDFKKDNKIIISDLNEDKINKIIEVCKGKDVDIDYFTSDKVYTDKYTLDNIGKYTLYDESVMNMVRKGRTVVDDPKAYCLENNIYILRLNIYITEKINKNELMNDIKKEGFDVTSSLPTNIEVMEEGCNKGKGITKLCEYLNMSLDDVMACGDSDNDIEALKVAKIKVVLKNGLDSVKKYADYITDDDCNNDGLAKFLYQYFN